MVACLELPVSPLCGVCAMHLMENVGFLLKTVMGTTMNIEEAAMSEKDI